MKFQRPPDRSVHELEMKANELEILFAAHKLRANSSQYVSSMEAENHDEALRRNSSARGEFYERYMKRREAKLRREWELKRAEKEAKLKALELMFDMMEAELRANLYGAINNRRDSMCTGRHMERHRSFNAQSSINRKQESVVDSVGGKEDEDNSKGRGRMLERSLSYFPVYTKENAKQSRGASFSKSKSTSQVAPIVKEENPSRSRSLRKSSGLVSEPIVVTPRKFEDKNTLFFGKLPKRQASAAPSPYLENKKGEQEEEADEIRSSGNMKELNYRFHDSSDRRKSWNGQAQVFHSRIPAPSPNFKLREDRVSTASLKGQLSFFSLSSFRSKTSDLKLDLKGGD